MSLRPWQWTVLVGLAIAFVAGAALLATDDEPRGDDEVVVAFDEVAWCQAAAAVEANSQLFDLEADDMDADDLLNTRVSLEEARLSAPSDLRPGIARLLDLVRLTTIEVEAGSSVADGVAVARASVDIARVRSAITELEAAVVACGHPSFD